MLQFRRLLSHVLAHTERSRACCQILLLFPLSCKNFHTPEACGARTGTAALVTPGYGILEASHKQAWTVLLHGLVMPEAQLRHRKARSPNDTKLTYRWVPTRTSTLWFDASHADLLQSKMVAFCSMIRPGDVSIQMTGGQGRIWEDAKFRPHKLKT